MAKDFYTAMKERRTIYGISKESAVSDERIEEVIREAIIYNPTAFNSQSARVILLLGENHDKLWDVTMEALRKVVPSEKFAPTEKKVNSFRTGHGTVLYFEDASVIQSLQQQFPSYKDNFPIWSQQSSGMLQYVVWAALDIEGLGASLQHYNELIEDEVKKQWNVPGNWRLIAQMPFGKPTALAGEKEFMPVEGRIKVFK